MLARVRQHRVSRVWIVLDRQWPHDDAHTSVAPKQLTHAARMHPYMHHQPPREPIPGLQQLNHSGQCTVLWSILGASSSPALLSASTQYAIFAISTLPKSACSCPLVTYTTDRLIDHGPPKHMHLHALFWHGLCASVEQADLTLAVVWFVASSPIYCSITGRGFHSSGIYLAACCSTLSTIY
jgi:hypothetical protein